jgi:hypothetical protein
MCDLHHVLPPHAANQLQMLDLCIFDLTKRLITCENRLERVNLQTGHLARILNSCTSAAVPHNVVQSFANGWISLILDEKGIIRCQITPHATRCVIGTSLVPGVSGAASDEAEQDRSRILGNFISVSRTRSSPLSERWRRIQ